jgi:hypothetical protein
MTTPVANLLLTTIHRALEEIRKSMIYLASLSVMKSLLRRNAISASILGAHQSLSDAVQLFQVRLSVLL